MSELVKIGEWTGQRRATIIFVHGLGGHPYDTWRRGPGKAEDDVTFWPRWLAEETPGSTVYTIGYSASAAGWFGQTMPIEDRAGNISQLLLNEPGILAAPITFVCHSLGGLIVKHLLLDLKMQEDTRPQSAALLNTIRQVAFLGTPHLGASHASLLTWLRFLVWPSSLTTALASDAPGLLQINRAYRTLALSRTGKLEHRVLYETRRTVLGQIVSEGAADPELNDSEPVAIDADHFKIAKPRDRGSLLYLTIQKFIGQNLPEAETGTLTLFPLPDFDGEDSFDYFGLAIRLAALLIFLGLLWFFWPERKTESPDPETIEQLTILASIPDTKNRLKLAEKLFKRKLNSEEVVYITNIYIENNVPIEINRKTELRLLNSRNTEELNREIANLTFQACGSTFQFTLAGERLQCASGQPVPMLPSPAIGGELKSRAALVFHFTAGDSDEGALRYFTDPNSKASAHLLVSRDGAVVQLVPFDRQAWHAGPSEWAEKGLKGLNAHSIGIDFSNRGHLKRNPDGSFSDWAGKTISSARVTTIKQGDQNTYWETFTPQQIKAAEGIVRAFRAAQPDIGLLGHSEIAAGRKTDPGPAFPLEHLRALK